MTRHPGPIHSEHAARTWLAFDANEASRSFYQPPYNCQPQSSIHSVGLGREAGLENSGQMLRGNAHSAVTYLQAYVASRGSLTPTAMLYTDLDCDGPPLGIASRALSTRFITTRSRWLGSIQIQSWSGAA